MAASYTVTIFLVILVVYNIQVNSENLEDVICGASNCTCTKTISDIYEIWCPLTTQQTPTAKLVYSPHKYLKTICINETVTSDVLRNLNFGSVSTVTFSQCPLPEISISELLTTTGITNTTKLVFQSYRNLSDELSPHHLSGLNNLQILILSLNGLKSLPPEMFADMQNLKELNLAANAFQPNAGQFKNLQNLRKLDLAMNSIHNLKPGVFEGLTELEQLDLWGNEMNNITSDIFQDINNLSSLHLDHNNLSSLPFDVFFNLPYLQDLSLSENKLHTLPYQLFSKLNKLEVLSLQDNKKLQHLPEFLLANLTHLKTVYLQNCDIEELPPNVLQGSFNLTYLNLSMNSINYLPPHLFSDTPEMIELDISYNALEVLPSHLFTSLNKLKVLYLHYNKLLSITSKMFQGLTNLRYLYLHNNALGRIEADSFLNLPELKEIYLSHNNLSLLKESQNAESPLVHSPKLETILLDFNNINAMFHDWQFVHTKLKLLNLSHNSFSYVEFQDLYFVAQNLTVDLNNNKIQTIDLQNAEEYIRLHGIQDGKNEWRNVVIKIDKNPLKCDCKTYDLLRYMEYTIMPEVHVSVNIMLSRMKCTSPADMAGISLAVLPSKKFTCSLLEEPTCPQPCQCFLRPYNRSLIVDCRGKYLTELPSALPNLPHTRIELMLRENIIGNLPQVLPPVYNYVKRISLSHNRISHFQPSTLPPNLEVLEIDNNQIPALDKSAMDAVTNISIISLHGNPWECDCKFVEFLESHSKQIMQIHDIKCLYDHHYVEAIANKMKLCTNQGVNTAVILCSLIVVTMAFIIIGYAWKKRKNKSPTLPFSIIFKSFSRT